MAKNLLFTLLFCSLYFAITTPCAGSELTLTKNHILQADECTAPPPDSFRITSIGTNIISLAWNPVWIGAGHTVVVLEKNSAGGVASPKGHLQSFRDWLHNRQLKIWNSVSGRYFNQLRIRRDKRKNSQQGSDNSDPRFDN